MPHKDPEARRVCHRASDKRRRAAVLAYRKQQRLEARWKPYGGELGYLIAQQARDAERDAKGFPVKYGPSLDTRGRLVA